MSTLVKEIEAFRRKARFYELPKAGKLLRRPLGFSASKVREYLANRRTVPTPVTARTFWGERMKLMLPEVVSVSIERYGFFEIGLTEIFLQYLKPGMTFFDVGSHFGYFSLLASHLVGPAGQVHSFEPTPSTYEVLASNARRHANITTNNVAVFSRRDRITFNDYGIRWAAFNTVGAGNLTDQQKAQAPPRVYQVQAITLDDYVRETGVAPDVAKIDAEGAELEILKGADHLLSHERPILSLEVGDVGGGEAESHRPVKYLLERGYAAWECVDGHIVKHEVASHYHYDNLLMIPAERGQPASAA